MANVLPSLSFVGFFSRWEMNNEFTNFSSLHKPINCSLPFRDRPSQKSSGLLESKVDYHSVAQCNLPNLPFNNFAAEVLTFYDCKRQNVGQARYIGRK